jgi:hypothetical protein
MMLKLPPRIKVLEALGAVADGRVRVVSEKTYKVRASTGNREYTVRIEDGRVSSDDNGTFYRNYVGYPIIAVLMVKGELSYDKEVAEALRGIPWKTLNEKEKSYSKVEQIVKQLVEKRGVEWSKVEQVVQKVMQELKQKRFEKL